MYLNNILIKLSVQYLDPLVSKLSTFFSFLVARILRLRGENLDIGIYRPSTLLIPEEKSHYAETLLEVEFE